MSITTHTLDVREAAEARHSVRSYRAESVSQTDLREILRLVSLAPSAFNLQPWRFVVVESEATKARLAPSAFNQPQVTSAPVLLVLYTDMQDALERVEEVIHPGLPAPARAATQQSIRGMFEGKSEEERERWGAAQGHIALGYLLLAAESLGYQTSAMAGFNPARVKEVLGLPPHVEIPALVALGHGAEEGYPHHRHPVERFARAA